MGEPTAVREEKEVFVRLFKPEALTSFFEPYPERATLEVSVFTSPDGPPTETLRIDSFFPFSTIDDLKLAIFNLKEQNPAFAPEHQFLAEPWGETGKPDQRAKRYTALDFFFKKGGSSMYLTEPFTAAAASQWDDRFVDSEGNRRILEGASRGRSTIEEIYRTKKEKPLILHLFLLRDILVTIRLPKPLSSSQHAGRIQSYFPSTTPSSDGVSLTEAQNEAILALNKYYISKQKVLVETLEPLLTSYQSEKFAEMKDVKYLRFVWVQRDPSQKVVKSLDTLFYEIGVSSARPFLRFYPADRVPISKIQVKGALPIPDLKDPCLLLQWAKEKSPTGDRDFLLGKITIESIMESRPPIYATLQAVDDGTAAIIIEPPKPQKRLDPKYDLANLGRKIKKGIEGFPFADGRVDIDEANLTFTIRLPEGQTKMSTKDIEGRLKIFKGFFQQIPSLEGENPVLSLRYKAVTNFFREDRVGLYLTELASRHVLNPSTAFEDMVNIIAEEFSLTKDQAKREFNKWKETKDDIIPIVPEYDIYKLKYNPGIDIHIYIQHPYVYVHLYRVDSYTNLSRVLTLLHMMLTYPKEELGIQEKQVRVLEESAEKALPEVGEAKAEGLVGSIALSVEGRSKEEAVAVEFDDEASNLGDAAVIEEWEVRNDDQNNSPESVAASVTPAAARTLVKRAEAAPVLKPAVVAAFPAAKKEAPLVTQATKLGVPTANYFIRKLQEADSRLFEYTKGIKGLKKYVSACAANEHRQPAVLDQAGFDRMMTEYRNDIEKDEIDIVTIGYNTREVSLRKIALPYKTDKEREEHTFMVLKYGTDLENQKYYLCAEYFCLRDEILIRKDDFEGTKFRANADPELVGKRKEPNHCPFCNGKLIKNYPDIGEGETVFPREVNISNKIKKHTHIGFYSKRLHPEGFGLPCCFTSKQKVKSTDEWFNPVREIAKKLRGDLEEADVEDNLSEAETESDEEEDEEEDVSAKKKVPNYQDTLLRVNRKYIVGPEKMPLEVGDEPQIGLLPPALNEYFKQNISDITQRAQIRQELKADAKGFLRIGVDNRGGHRAESFFAAIAPFLNLNTADQVRELMKTKITPRIFVSANYGNLMMEFYDPAVPERQVQPPEIRDFGSKRLNIKRQNQYWYIRRIYKSYINFWGEADARLQGPRKSFLNDPNAVKQYRQFAPLLAQPNVITQRGIVFIVLDIQPDESVKVICPPYGFNDTMRNADIGFILKQGDIWEPIFYVDAQRPPPKFRFQKVSEPSWPAILIKRVEEFREQCKGPDVAQYTGLQMIKRGSKLINLSLAVRIFGDPFEVVGVVRDTYNHIIAAVFKTDPDRDDSTIIALPVTDDGVIRSDFQIFLNWDGFTVAPANRVVEFYETNVAPLLSFYPSLAAGYKPEYKIIPTKQTDIQAIQLANGIYIPAGVPEPGTSVDLPGPPGGQPEKMEWLINKEIMWHEGKEYKIPQLKQMESEKQLQELYEHFRLTFSDWLASPESGAMKADLQDVLFYPSRAVGIDLPVFEKRKRLEILLTPIVLQWMEVTEKGPSPFESLLRINCRSIQNIDKCQGPCKWKPSADGTGGSCLIHVPRPESATSMNTPEVFLARLIDELIRFPGYRAELLKENKKHVSHLVSMKSAVRIDNAYYVPEDSMEWTDLLRMECRKPSTERGQFFEEISSDAIEPAVEVGVEGVEEEALLSELTEIPESLKLLLGGADPKTENLAIQEWTESQKRIKSDLEKTLLALNTSMDGLELMPESTEFSLKDLRTLAQRLGKGFIQINLDVEPGKAAFRKVKSRISPDFFVLVKQRNSMRFLVEKTKGQGPISQDSLPGVLIAQGGIVA